MDVPTVGEGHDQVSYLDVCAAIIAYGVMTILALFVVVVVLAALAVPVSIFLDMSRESQE